MTTPPLLSPDVLRCRVFPNLTPADWNRFFLPHYGFGRTPAADFHAALSADLDGLHRRRGVGRAYIAPRGGAKSTWGTLAYVLRCAVHGWERHVVILSDSAVQATLLLSAVKAELEGNPRLLTGYPASTGPGPVWRTDCLQLPNGVMVEAFGRGAQIRGRKNRSRRPSLVVLDDVQGVKDVRSSSERRYALEWFRREVLPAGDAQTNWLSFGSAVHREAVAVVAQTMHNWVGRTFRAVHGWPDREDLWAEWGRLATNLADEHREQTARDFYLVRANEMDAGARSYWPARWPLDALMAERAKVGEGSFDSEYQGNPHSGEGKEWPASFFDRPDFWFDHWPEDDIAVTVQAIDPSKGTGSKGADYQAHVRLGLGRRGTIYVEAELRREADYVRRMLDLAALWRPAVCVAESNNTMGLLLPEIARQLEERRAAGKPLLLNYEEKHNTLPKLARIRTVGGYLSRGQTRVRRTEGGRLLVDQWRDTPNSEFDDGPDAVATALEKLEKLVNGSR